MSWAWLALPEHDIIIEHEQLLYVWLADSFEFTWVIQCKVLTFVHSFISARSWLGFRFWGNCLNHSFQFCLRNFIKRSSITLKCGLAHHFGIRIFTLFLRLEVYVWSQFSWLFVLLLNEVYHCMPANSWIVFIVFPGFIYPIGFAMVPTK